METFTDRVWVLKDDIGMDIIISTEYLALKTIEDMKQCGLSPLRPELAKQIKEGDIIVAGRNFSYGPFRKWASKIIRTLGIRCVIAKSYTRIFFRNSIDNGLLLIEQPDLRDAVPEGDEITVGANHFVRHQGKGCPITSLPGNLVDIISAGDLVKAVHKLNGLD